MLCAGSVSAHIDRMSDELLALLWSLRFLLSAHLRRALLVSAWHVFSTAPTHVLFSAPGRIEEWKTYLESVATDEPDDECRLLAHYDLSVLRSKLQQHSGPLYEASV